MTPAGGLVYELNNLSVFGGIFQTLLSTPMGIDYVVIG